MPRRDVSDILHERAYHLAWMSAQWARFARLIAEYEARGLVNTLPEVPRYGKGGTPTGFAVTVDQLEQDRKQATRDIVHALGLLDNARCFMASVLLPIDPGSERRPGSVTQCVSATCQTVIETSRSAYALSPWCDPCLRWVKENDGRPVPAKVIAERERSRTRRAESTTT